MVAEDPPTGRSARRSGAPPRRGPGGARSAACLSLAALGLLAACGGPAAAPADRDEIVVALRSAPTHLDPRIATDQATGRIFQVMLNGLVTKDRNGNLVPDLARSWDVLDGGKRYRFHLRPGVRFHDGRELGAADVVWTLRSILDGTVPSPKRGALPGIERVAEIDELTVDIELAEPSGALLVNLTPYVGIVPRGTTPDQMNEAPVGTGPYRLVERRPDRVAFEAFAGYRDGPPRTARLVFRDVPDATVRALELQKGSVHLVVNDLTPDVVARFRTDPAFKVLESPGASYAYLGLNLEDPILSRVEVRRALALAIDRELIVRSLWRGLGAVTESLLRPGHWARHDGLEPIPYDPAAARALLDRAGFPDPDGDGPATRFRLTYKSSTEESGVLLAQIVQAMLARIGVGIDIRSYEWATFYGDVKKGNFQLFSMMWTGTVDPDIYKLVLHSASVPPHGANRGRYRNPEFDRLVTLGARFAEPERRRPYYLRAQEIVARDLPYISLFIQANFAVMPVALEGYANHAFGGMYSLKDAYWSDRHRAAAPDGG